MTDRYGWKLVFHDTIRDQLVRLYAAFSMTDHLKKEDRELDPNVQLLGALSQLMFKTIPEDPTLSEYSRGVPTSGEWQFWRRVKFGERFTLYFRFHTAPNLIIYALITDSEQKKRADQPTA